MGARQGPPRHQVQDSRYYWNGSQLFRKTNIKTYSEMTLRELKGSGRKCYRLKYGDVTRRVYWEEFLQLLDGSLTFQELFEADPEPQIVADNLHQDEHEPILGRPVYLEDVLKSELTGVFYRNHLHLWECIFGYAHGIVGLGYYRYEEDARKVFDFAMKELKEGTFKRSNPFYYRQKLKL